VDQSTQQPKPKKENEQMNLTNRQTAHVLAALRRCQSEDLSGMPHFEETSPLPATDIDDLCEKLNEPDEVETAEPDTEGDVQSRMYLLLASLTTVRTRLSRSSWRKWTTALHGIA
jgi:hypothetical protein